MLFRSRVGIGRRITQQGEFRIHGKGSTPLGAAGSRSGSLRPEGVVLVVGVAVGSEAAEAPAAPLPTPTPATDTAHSHLDVVLDVGVGVGSEAAGVGAPTALLPTPPFSPSSRGRMSLLIIQTQQTLSFHQLRAGPATCSPLFMIRTRLRAMRLIVRTMNLSSLGQALPRAARRLRFERLFQ